MPFRALAAALPDLALPGVRRMLLKVLVIGLALLLLPAIGAGWALGLWLPEGQAMDGLAAAAGVVLLLLLGWFGWRVVAVALVNLFADDVVDAVEARHYPARSDTAKRAGLLSGGAMALRSAGRAILANLLASPVYLLLLVTGIGTAVAFLVVNGWLLGRDMEEMVANRHRAASDDPAWRWPPLARFLFGVTGTLLLAVPVVGLLAPAWIAAAATHFAHRRADRSQP